MTILNKKGDIINGKLLNYQLYKLFIIIITNKLGHKLDNHQPLKKAGFRSDVGTNDNLQVLKYLIDKVIK